VRRLGSEWWLLVLRAFLGIVFVDGGISKIADRRFLDASDYTSMHASVVGVRTISPIGSLLGPVADHSTFFGVLMAIGELAVGLGICFGLFTRIAAVGGMLVALSLWLTISWGASPWFTSADLVYLFAFTPLALHGAGDTVSLDAWLARVAARQAAPARDRARGGPPVRGQDRARRGQPTPGTFATAPDGTRRALLAGALAVLGAAMLGIGALFRGKAPAAVASPTDNPQPTPPAPTDGSPTTGAPTTTAPTTSAPTTKAPTTKPPAAGGPVLVKTSDVPVGSAKGVVVSGQDIWVLQLQSGQFTAFDAACPHEGCPVQFDSSSKGFVCPCHGSSFDSTGKVLSPPARRNLTKIAVAVDGQDVRKA
jgi:thiosulfate dehydrogenase [quinone] large subunit